MVKVKATNFQCVKAKVRVMVKVMVLKGLTDEKLNFEG